MQTKDKLSEVYFFSILFASHWLISPHRVDFGSTREGAHRATEWMANEWEKGKQTNQRIHRRRRRCSQGRENMKNSPVAFCVAADSDSVPVPSDIWPYRIICLCNFITIYTVRYIWNISCAVCMCGCVWVDCRNCWLHHFMNYYICDYRKRTLCDVSTIVRLLVLANLFFLELKLNRGKS